MALAKQAEIEISVSLSSKFLVTKFFRGKHKVQQS